MLSDHSHPLGIYGIQTEGAGRIPWLPQEALDVIKHPSTSNGHWYIKLIVFFFLLYLVNVLIIDSYAIAITGKTIEEAVPVENLDAFNEEKQQWLVQCPYDEKTPG